MIAVIGQKKTDRSDGFHQLSGENESAPGKTEEPSPCLMIR